MYAAASDDDAEGEVVPLVPAGLAVPAEPGPPVGAPGVAELGDEGIAFVSRN